MLLMEISQNPPKNKFIIKLASYLALVEKYLELVLGSEQSYQFDLNPTLLAISLPILTQLHQSTAMGFTVNTFKYEQTYLVIRK